ncbi:DUF3850 domain-containing protein [Brucella pseudogrignonensis]|uniref:DUF3850 domain-containing protein n=1 Tax=Brucella pseudogrignonensis TaxID=419475 RepID=UPI001E5089F4|nr:DUF3850 domain-containing protein [Brucella pseudogrignonensis]MCD4509759.1 DUF3850 domain-containing protein [Brucella pseudogrignonensis]
MQMHNLKIDAQPFADLLSGAKTGEVRNDDRGFEVGDTVHLTCVDGRTMDRTISHIQRGYGLPEGICVLSYTRTAAPVEGLETVEAQVFKDGFWQTVQPGSPLYGLRPTRGLVPRPQAEAIIAVQAARISMQDQEIYDQNLLISHQLKKNEALQADNAALTARVKKLAADKALWEATAKEIRKQAKSLETQLAVARKALQEIAGNTYDDSAEKIARAALEAKS